MARRASRRPGPCPRCDAELDPALAEAGCATCPACGTALTPVRVAGFWRRLAAFTVDATILALSAGPLHALALWLTDTPWPQLPDTWLAAGFAFVSLDWAAVFAWLAPFLAMVGLYALLFTALRGRTPGQQLMRVTVIGRGGRRPGPVAACARVVGLAASAAPAGLGGLWIAFDREKRALHDHVAGTYVVRVT